MINIFVKKPLSWGYLMIIAIGIGSFSCENDAVPSFDAQSVELQVADPYLQVQTPVIGFQAGTPSYEFEMNVINGVKDIQTVNVYSMFSDVTGAESNEVLLTSYSVTSPTRTIVTDELTYDDLKAGITVDGQALPDDQTLLKVGAGWTLRFEGVRSDGTVVPLGGTVVVGVLSRFAGIYKVLTGTYTRFDGVGGDYTGQTRFIGSVDENTFSYNDYWGYFPWTGNQFNFDIDFTTSKIYVPITVDGLFSGTAPLRCGEDNFNIHPCDGSNILIPDEVTGKHRIILTYGYLGAGGNREFYEELEKVVD